jgi:hypothetical protein
MRDSTPFLGRRDHALFVAMHLGRYARRHLAFRNRAG